MVFAFISQSFLPCVPHFAQPRRLRSGCWWQRYCGLRATTEDHTAGEEEGALSRVDRDLPSRPAVCALLVPESIALAISHSVQFSSVAQLCPTLCDPMNRSMPGLPVHHHSRSSPKLMCIELVMPSSHIILCRPLLLLPPIPPSISLFQ